MPAADSCRTVRVDRPTPSSDSGTCDRPPEVILTAFNAQPPNLQPVPLMDVDFAIFCPLVRRRMPHIRFLSIGSRLCSTLLSDSASRRRPGASLSLLLHQDVKGTCTPKLLNMLGTQRSGLPVEQAISFAAEIECWTTRSGRLPQGNSRRRQYPEESARKNPSSEAIAC